MKEYMRAISSGSVAIGLSTVLALVSSVITVPLFLRAVGPDLYGLFIVISIVVGFVSIGDFGVLNAVANKISYLLVEKKYRDISELFSGTLLFLLFVAIVFWVLVGVVFLSGVVSVGDLFGVNDQMEMVAEPVFYLLLFFGGIQLFFGGALASLFRGLNALARFHIVQSWYVICYSFVFIFFLLLRPSIISIVLFQGFASTVRILCLFVYVQRRFSWLVVCPHIRLVYKIRPLIKHSLTFFVLMFGNSLIGKTDGLVISHVVGVGAVTPFSLSDRLFKLPSSAVRIAEAAESSVAALYKKNDLSGMVVLYSRVLRMNILGKMVPLFFLFVYSRELITLWVGAEFFYGYLFTGLFFFSYMLYAWVGPHFVFINAMFKHQSEVVPMVANVCINLVVSIILARHMGIIGVIIGTIAGNLLTNVLYLPFFLRRFISVRPFTELFHILIRFLLPATVLICMHILVVSWLQVDLWGVLCALLSGIVYLYMVYFFVLQKQEKQYILEQVREYIRRFLLLFTYKNNVI